MDTGSFVRQEIVSVCRRLYEKGLIAGPDGNISVRLSAGSILITPAALSKVDVTPDDLVEVSMDGVRISGYREPSSEVHLHVRLYTRRPDVQAVVHAHPPTATGFAVAGEGFESYVLPELVYQMGRVPLVPYATPGTPAVADAFEPFIAGHDAFLMANHGATTTGPSLLIAHQRMESVEHSARILLTARLLGRVTELSAEQAAGLLSHRA
ncbi:MAG TPA: class II aldolase/adducin family protein [Gemmatimonadaceae bacterium]